MTRPPSMRAARLFLQRRSRYVWHAELDLMARLARMSLRERHGGWNREPFTSDSTTHISVWQKNA
jgi:hypothetical protein